MREAKKQKELDEKYAAVSRGVAQEEEVRRSLN